MPTSEAVSTATGLVRVALKLAGPRAPSVLLRYAELTYLNRTSRARSIRMLPQLAGGSAMPSSTHWDADIVVPVYNDFEGVRGLLATLRQEAPRFHSLVLVHDCSTDARVLPLLRKIEDEVANAVLIENDRNCGFLRTCNRGLEASTRDVVILNTDIEVPSGALGRLIDTLRGHINVATVTPFSSNAYCAGFPDLNYENRRPFGATTAQVDSAFQAIGPFAPIDIPRGVGFCMAMSRDAIDAVGVFDEAFGAGYGEEADFCLRARKAGFRNLLAPNTYVYHKAGQSFGASSRGRAREALIRLLLRHPNYAGMVRHYLAGGEARAVGFLALARLAELGGRGLVIEGDVPLLQRGTDGKDVEVRVSGEAYRFAFTSRNIAEQAFRLAGVKD